MTYEELKDLYLTAKTKANGKPIHNSYYHIFPSNPKALTKELMDDNVSMDIYSYYRSAKHGRISSTTKDNITTFSPQAHSHQNAIERIFNVWITSVASKSKRLSSDYRITNDSEDYVLTPGTSINQHGQFITVPPYTKLVPTKEGNKEFTKMKSAIMKKIKVLIALAPEKTPLAQLNIIENTEPNPYHANHYIFKDSTLIKDETAYNMLSDPTTLDFEKIVRMFVETGNWHNTLYYLTSQTPGFVSKTSIKPQAFNNYLNKLRDPWLIENKQMKKLTMEQL